MRLNFYLKTILWGLIGYPLSPVIAENIDTTVLLQEVVVSGSRQERPISRTPGMIQVISPLLLRTTPAQSVDGLLSMISGINTTRSDGLSQLHTNVSIRGLSGNEQGRTLVLYDGIPLNISDEGSVNWNSLQLNQIQRIEVLKGPGSSLYGNHAMGGVIHIISKKPTQPFAIDLAGNYGSLNSFKGSLGISRQVNERWSWMLSTYYQQSDGFNPIPDSLRTIPDYSVARFMREGGIYTKLRFTPHPLFQTEVALDIYRDKRGEGEKIEAPDGMFRRFDHQRLQARFWGAKAAFSYQLALYFQRQNYFKLDERMKGERYQRFDVRSKRDDWGVIGHLHWAKKRNDFSMGFELKNGEVAGGDYYVTSSDHIYNQGSMTFLSLFVQDEFKFFRDYFWMQIAMRYDHAFFHRGFFEAIGENVADFKIYNNSLATHHWNSFSPRVALRFNPHRNLSLYFSYAHGFRASILDDLCRSGWMWVGPKIANPTLGPEHLDQYEVGGNWRVNSRFACSFSAYYAHGTDFLYYVATGEKLWGRQEIFRRENVSQVEMKGVEIDGEYTLFPGLKFQLNYTYNLPKIKEYSKNKALEGKVLTYAPKQQWKGYLLWTGRHIEAMLRGSYKSEQYTSEDNGSSIPAFSLWDFQCTKWFWKREFSVGIELLNLFDCRCMNSALYRSVGRQVNLKLSWHLMRE